MKESWIIVLAPESAFDNDGDLDRLPAVPTDTVAKALEGCPLLQRDGLSFRSPLLEPVRLPPDGVRSLPLNDVDNPVIVAAMAEGLARAVGPVTILDDDLITRVCVKSGMSADAILSALRESAGPVVDAPPRLRISSDPPSFAPGRPEKRLLPPMKHALIVGAVLEVFGIPSGLYYGARGLLGCDPPPVREESVNREAADTESAFLLAHVLLTTDKREPAPDGRIEVEGKGFMAHVSALDFNGRRYVCDGWKTPIRCMRHRDTYRYVSFGPNGLDDRGRGDDIVKVFTTGR